MTRNTVLALPPFLVGAIALLLVTSVIVIVAAADDDDGSSNLVQHSTNKFAHRSASSTPSPQEMDQLLSAERHRLRAAAAARRAAAGSASHSEQQKDDAEEEDSGDHRLIDAMQLSSPPGVKISLPNFALPALVTHVVEFEIVKAWRTILVENKTAAESAVAVNNDKKQAEQQEQQQKIEPVANVTHWELMGSVLIALYGDAEPELVQQFLRKTIASYGHKAETTAVAKKQQQKAQTVTRTMADSFTSVHPVSMSQLQGAVTFVPSAALPKHLLFDGDHHKTSGDARDVGDEISSAVRPPWAPRNSSRWLCSTVQRSAFVHFSHFDGHPNSSSSSNNNNSAPATAFDDETEKLIRFAGDPLLHEHMEKRRQRKKQLQQGDQEEKKEKEDLLFRLGSVVHRHCSTPMSSSSSPTTAGQASGGNKAPFTWYAISDRAAPQLLRNEELLHRAETASADAADKSGGGGGDNDTSVDALRQRVRKMHDMCSGDRIIGHVITGYPHLRRLGKMPQHRPLFARDHYLRRRKRFASESKSRSRSKSMSAAETETTAPDERSNSSVFDTLEDDEELLFFDDHHEEFFSPFLEGVPMQHVSVARASVYPFRGLDDLLRQRRDIIKPHVAPPSSVQQLIDAHAASPATQKERLRQLDADKAEEWRRYAFGRSVSAFDLDSDVRHTRAQVAMGCLREQQEALDEFDRLQSEAWHDDEDAAAAAEADANATGKNASGRSRQQRGGGPSRLQHLLDAVSNKSRQFLRRSRSRSASGDAADSSLFRRFVRFTGGAPIGPNATYLTATWQWADRHHRALTRQALEDRIARHPVLAQHRDEAKRRERRRKMDQLQDNARRFSFLHPQRSSSDGGERSKSATAGNAPKKHTPEDTLRQRMRRLEEEKARDVERLVEYKHRGVLSEEEFREEIGELEVRYYRRKHGAGANADGAAEAAAAGAASASSLLQGERTEDEKTMPSQRR